ncbi:MAG TPA: hypothetical protein VED41_03870 [Solirubrobacteraceae bacterium]|nr:hypothetical protein [Solirubrobacteraceae bacterium]
MTRTIVFRRIVGIVAVALALGAIAGPASARTFDFNSNGALVEQPPPSMPAPSTPIAAEPASGGSSINWGYVAIGSSVVALVLIGVGAVATGRRRSREDSPRRATIAG